jgi:hypothetical protein
MATGFNPLTPAMPSFNAGELLLIGTGVRANGETLSAPAGWTLLTPDSNAQNVKVFGRIAQPGDTAPTIDWSASSQAFAQIACFNGDVPSSLTGAVAFQVDQAGTDTALQYPRLTMGAAKTLVIAIGKKSKTATSDGTTADPLTGFTQIGSSANSGNNVCSYWGYQIQDTCQNVLAATQTFSGTAESAAYQTSLIALLSQLPDITPDYAGVIARVQGYR